MDTDTHKDSIILPSTYLCDEKHEITQKIKTTRQHPVLDANPPLSMSSEPSELSPGTPFPTIPPGIFNGPGLMGGLPPLATSDRAPDELSPRLRPDLGEVRRLVRYGA